MALPGTTITLRDTAPPRSAPTDTSPWFIAGFAEKGAAEPILVTSIADYLTKFGARVSYGYLYDCLDIYFREGGSQAYLARVLGPDAAPASFTLADSADADTLTVEAASDGDWGNALKIAVEAGDDEDTFKLVVSDAATTLETSPSFATKADAITWAEASSYIRLTDEASELPPDVISAQALVGGDDDHADAGDDEWAAALALFTKDLGPGQVSMPGRTTSQAHLDTLAHAASHNRVAILDGPDTDSKATLVTAADAARSSDGHWGGMFAPWATVAGIVVGTTRTVPYSAIEAGIIARNDSAGVSANQPSAGQRYGQSKTAIGLSQIAWSTADRQDLNDAGVNVALVKNQQVLTYGYRTLADPDTEPNYLLLSNMRYLMSVFARADVIAERYVFSIIDGAGHTIADFGGDLTGMLMPDYAAGALFGSTPGEAFFVDVGPQVNTTETIAALELHAVLQLRISPYGETVTVEIVKKAISEEVS